MSSHLKIHTAAKLVKPRSPKLNKFILDTMKTISDIVGATLGPGGAPVLIERQDFSLTPLVTKDGVTVFSSLGFKSAIAHSIMESARDAAVRTVSDAGDGTTTATILAYALLRETQIFHAEHPEVPPQRIVQTIQKLFEEVIEPTIKNWATPVNLADDTARKTIHSVATISANGETKLADAVIQCFDLVGDKGNVSLSEKSGPSSYLVEKVEGFPISTGYEDSCGKFMQKFIIDPANNRAYLEQPVVVLYNGVLHDINTAMPVIDQLQKAAAGRGDGPPIEGLPTLKNGNVVFVAHGFGDQFLGTCAMNIDRGILRIVPVVTPRTAQMGGEVEFLNDLAAVTGARVFDPLTNTFESAEHDLRWLGHAKEFELHRFRANIIGVSDEDELLDRVDQVEQMAKTAISELDRRLIQERLAALSGGIAKLFVVGSSTGDIKERKDRADDAVRAVQGALKSGVLPGGAWTLLQLARIFEEDQGKNEEASIAKEVLAPALREPFRRLLLNTGMTDEEALSVKDEVEADLLDAGVIDAVIFDVARRQYVPAFEYGILDSVPAVLEAIRNSVSIATLLGTLGGVVVFERDRDLELGEARAAMDYEKSAQEEANERW